MSNADIITKFNITITPKTSLNKIDLSFAKVREYDRTKHVHRLHPYLGKFIPQLVEVFLRNFFKILD